MASLMKRNKKYYLQWRVGKKIKRKSLNTSSLQIAKEKLRQFESTQFKGEESPFPTKTPLVDIVTRYVEHIRTIKTEKSAQTDVYYLRQMFGPMTVAPRWSLLVRKRRHRATMTAELALTVSATWTTMAKDELGVVPGVSIWEISV
jgi:hypothetical protein